MTLKAQLTQTFSSNFLAYYHSHVAHVNITGENFPSYHELLGSVYESFQSDIDTLAELLRTIRAKMPNRLDSILTDSSFNDHPVKGDAEELLTIVYGDVIGMIDEYRDLYEAAEAEDNIEISNFSQDKILKLQKTAWMLRSTLEEEDEEDEDESEE